MPDALSNQIDKARDRPPVRPLTTELAKAKPEIEAALPENFPGGADRFVRIVTTAVRMAPDLTKCSARSVIGAAMQAAQLGLTPGALGEAWIIPYKSRGGGYEASFQIGWRGMVALAGRAGLRVTGAIVHERDEFDWELGLSPNLVHRPYKGGERGKSTHWYAIVRDVDTGQLAGFAVLDRAMVEKRRRASRSPDSPAWRDWFDEMALSKAAREALRFAPLTVEMGTALASEETLRTRIVRDFDEPPEEWPEPDDAVEIMPSDTESASEPEQS